MNLPKTVKLLACSAALFSTVAAGIGSEDIEFPTSASFPPAALDVLRQWPQSNDYVLSDHINPYFLQGDFNGDHALDVAVLVRHKRNRKAGIALVHGQTGSIVLIGADQQTDIAGDDLGWMDAWRVIARGPVEQGATDEKPPMLRGDAILAIKTEAASGLIYWNGKRYAWYQQGD